MENGWPIILVEGSPQNGKLLQYKETLDPGLVPNLRLREALDKGAIYGIKNSSEDVGSIILLALTVDLQYSKTLLKD